MKKNILNGVGLLLVSAAGRVAIIRELIPKPKIKKEAGMLAFPMETVKKGESDEDALKRLVFEELGLDAESISHFCKFKDPYVEHSVSVTMFYALFMEEGEPVLCPRDSDIEFEGWMHLNKLLEKNHLRREVVPIVNIFNNMDFVRCCRDRKKLKDYNPMNCSA
ncbi:NUDIX hydrolase [Patescibacteria group bacterium]